MKHIIRIFTLILLLGLIMPDATAQVSVRRGGSRTESSSSRKKDKEKKQDKQQKGNPNSNPAQARPAVQPTGGTEAGPGRNTSPVTTPAVATAAPTRVAKPKKTGKEEAVVDGNTQRQQSFAEYQRLEEGYVPWQHVVYRELDVTEGSNASLYYPQEPQDGLTNFFRVILDGLCTGRLHGYEYLDGREIFEQKYEVKVKDVLDKFQILYRETPGKGQNATTTYQIEEMDVPCNEVLSYFIKERWEFNQKTSKYGPRILGICPVLHRSGDFGGEAIRYPMFWVNYEDLRPLLRDQLIMSDGMNNAPRFTMEEFFTLEQYQGEIYKVQNVRGLSLMQQYPDADTLKLMRAQIEAQLRGFGDSIWVHEPTAAELAMQDSIAAAKRAERRASKSKKSDDKKAIDNSSATSDDKNAKRNRRTKEEVDMAAVEDAKEQKEEEVDARVEETGTAHSARRSARRR